MQLYPDGRASFDAPQYGVRDLPQARLTAQSPGGGGWGDPQTRDPAMVLRDVRDGLVSREAAENIYAVAIDQDGRAVDKAATARLRAS